MKKFIFAAALALVSLAGAAKTADELRIYINPGHGSYTANDRPMAVLGHAAYNRYNTDTTSFFESNTNLRKGFGILEKLRQMGLKFDPTLNQTGERWQIGAARDMSNNIVMSHVKCGPYHDDNGTENQLNTDKKPIPEDLYYYNRNLTEICAEVEANNFDMFISIHSNAVDSSGWKTTNFPIVLYRGYDDTTKSDTGLTSEHAATSKLWGQTVWPYHMSNTHEGWTAYTQTNMNVRGDINFYGSSSVGGAGYRGYLGVLKHGVPGFLIEGYFHQYAPAALRHMNWDVNYVEGYNYAHGIADIFGLEKEKTGIIYGIVRDEHEKFDNPAYVAIPGSDDMYTPLNNVKVSLRKGTEVVAEYTTDGQYNGAFVFDNVEPGNYTMTFAAEGYKSPKPVEVTVKAAEVVYPKAFMESESYIPPTVVYVNYPDPLEGTTFSAPAEVAFKQSVVDKEIAELAGKTVKRFISYDDKLFVLAHDENGVPTVLVLSANTLEVLATPSLEGCEGTHSALSDIQVTADGYLIGCNMELCHYNAEQVQEGETMGENKIYRWDNDEETGLPTGDPIEWIVTKKSGNFFRGIAGLSMVYNGTTEEGVILLSVQTASATKYFFNYLAVFDGKLASESHRNNGEVCDYFDANVIGTHTLTMSPLSDDSFIANTTKASARQYTFGAGTAGMTFESELPAEILPAASAQAAFFKYNGASFMVAPDVDENGNNTGLRLLNITNGLDKAEIVSATNTAFDTAEGVSASAGRVKVSYNNLDKVSAADIVLYLLRDNKLSVVTTEGVKQPLGHREFAYDIELVEGEKVGAEQSYTVNFKSTGDAVEANLVCTNLDPNAPAGDDVIRIAGISPVVKGDNSINFTSDALVIGNFNIAVEIVSRPISAAGEYKAIDDNFVVRGGVINIVDPESDNLGYTVYTAGAANGVNVIAPDGTVSGPFFKADPRLSTTNQSSMFRGDARGGMAVFADWSDAGAGYWVIDPSNPVEMTQLLAGERIGTDGTKGSYTYNGKIIGGGSSCVAFQGTGDDQKMYSFLEDYPAGNTPGSQNKVYRYDIGSAEQITEAPAKVFDQLSGGSFLANQNVDIKCFDGGFIVSQNRGEGNNAAGCPAWAFMDNEGLQIANSASYDYITSGNSGIAISPDGKYFACAQYSCITVMAIEWNEYGEPEFTHLCDIPTATNDWAHLSFDAGNNIHAYTRQLNGYKAYAFPAERPVSLVPAKAKYVATGTTVSGVSEVVVDNDAPVVYYNLHGMRVNSNNLTTGVYIKVQGTTATKVIVK
ncbi:MAG: carboxypeptidase-like regulatory domain-containing protein [Muribaculaceae bacterium]|nr:carboxypeptidase-like regulatory domain-containing protein [Muribaculaceae bacterium]